MTRKRKRAADGKTPPSKDRPGCKPKALPVPAQNLVAVEAPPAGLPGLEPTTQPAPAPAPSAVAVEAPPSSAVSVEAPPPSAVSVETPPPPASSAMVTSYQPEDEGKLLALARVSAAEEEVVRLLDSDVPKTVLRCDVCHSSMKPPVYQCSLLRHVACSDCSAGECRPCADLGNAAVYAKSSYLDTLFSYFKVPCPYSKYGCASSVAYGDVQAHAAACACAPCTCPNCSFEGSPAELLSHLTDKVDGHGWLITKITYGKEFVSKFSVLANKRIGFLFVAEDDSSLFCLEVGGRGIRVTVVCVRGTGTGPVYTSSLTVVGPPAEGRRLTLRKKVMKSCSDLKKFNVEAEPDCDCVFGYPEMLHGGRTSISICASASARPRACLLGEALKRIMRTVASY